MRGRREARKCRRGAVAVRRALGACALLAALGCGGSTTGVRAGVDASIGAVAPDAPDASDAPDAPDASTDDVVVGDDAGCGLGFCPVPMTNQPACPPGSLLDCYVDSNCPDGGQTTLTGTIYDPAGRNPIDNAAVFVPSRPDQVPPVATGTSSCKDCNVMIEDFAAVARTDAAGQFVLKGVPTGTNVPLVIQAGKWRRTITVPTVKACASMALAPATTRLPRNHTEGDMPQMALLTGGCDNVACFLRGVGIDATEFTAPGAGGRVDVYEGLGATGAGAALSNSAAGDCTTDACPLWSSKKALEAYDTVFLGCECSEHNETKPPSSLQAMHDWLGEGGVVFATHSQTTWFKNGPADLQGIASWTSGPASGAPGPFVVDSSAASEEFKAWLGNVGAADDAGVLPLDPAEVSTSVTTVAFDTTAWIHDLSTIADGGGPQTGNVKAFSARMPVAAADASLPIYCGAVHVTDIHPGGGQALQTPGSDGSSAPASIPAACDGGPLSAGEKALEYLLFDSSMCISSGLKPELFPPPPPL